MSDQSLAAVDCGTNSTRLLVVHPDGKVAAREMTITRLGEGVDAGRRLLPEAMERTLAVLRDYRRIMDTFGAARSRVVATSAARDATNAEDFMEAVAGITGARPEILTGEEEGRLSFAGATAHLPGDVGLAAPGPVLVADIGGGSTELAIGPVAGASPESEEVSTRSLDIGCVRVSERFLVHDPPRPDELVAAREAVESVIGASCVGLPELAPESRVIGLAGTVSTLTCLARGITVYDRARIHHAVLTREDVGRWLDALAATDSRGRLEMPGMVAGREDVIVGGVLILDVIMNVFARPRCLVSEDDILDGLVMSLRAGMPRPDEVRHP